MLYLGIDQHADLRALQLLLGHSRLTTTQLYTHVSIQRLKEVHARTHPARPDTEPAEAPAADPSAE